jgi:hypothetical protein
VRTASHLDQQGEIPFFRSSTTHILRGLDLVSWALQPGPRFATLIASCASRNLYSEATSSYAVDPHTCSAQSSLITEKSHKLVSFASEAGCWMNLAGCKQTGPARRLACMFPGLSPAKFASGGLLPAQLRSCSFSTISVS